MGKRKDKQAPAPEATKAEAAAPVEEQAPKPNGQDTPRERTPEDYHYRSRSEVLSEIAQGARERRDQALREKGFEPADTSEALDEDAASAKRDDGEETPPDTDAAAVDRDAPGTEKSAPGAGEKTPPPDAAPPAEPAKRKFIVDGVEREFTEDEITAIVQKSATVDKRLEEATRIREEARRTAPPPARPGVSEAPPSAAPSAADVGRRDEAATQALVAKLTKAVISGSEEEVAEAFGQALGVGRGEAKAAATQTQGMGAEEIQTFVARYVDEATAFHSARASLDLPAEQGGYGDLWSDPMLQAMFINRENQLMDGWQREGKAALPYKERYAQIAKEIRDWRDGLVQKHSPKPTPPKLADRDSRKAQTVVVKSGTAKPSAPTEGQPKTHQQKLDEMRAARGQARI